MVAHEQKHQDDILDAMYMLLSHTYYIILLHTLIPYPTLCGPPLLTPNL